MNWYKRAITETTKDYWKEVDNESTQYIPNTEKVLDTLQKRFNTQVEKDLGCGDSGCAYLLANGDVLKITTNANEAKAAQIIMENPHPNIIQYKNIWNSGKLWYIVMEQISNVNSNSIRFILDPVNKMMKERECYNPFCAFSIVKQMKPFRYQKEILSYLNYLQKFIPESYDFLNPQNTGTSKYGMLVFFDIT